MSKSPVTARETLSKISSYKYAEASCFHFLDRTPPRSSIALHRRQHQLDTRNLTLQCFTKKLRICLRNNDRRERLSSLGFFQCFVSSLSSPPQTKDTSGAFGSLESRGGPKAPMTSTAEVASGPVAAQDSLPTRSLCRCAAAQKHALSGVSKGTDTCVAPTSPCRTKLDTHVSLENSQSRRRNLLPTTSVVEVPRSTESLRMQT